ncbi:hypothetical protein D3C87_1650090 [compost metagenome]
MIALQLTQAFALSLVFFVLPVLLVQAQGVVGDIVGTGQCQAHGNGQGNGFQGLQHCAAPFLEIG